MTPAALTPAARKTSAPPRRSGGSRATAGPRTSGRAAAPERSAAKTGHRSPLRPGIAPRSPRRVSGPLGGLTRGRATTTERPPAAAPRRTASPRRRVRTAVAPAGASLAARAAAYVRALPDHSLLDRIIRGRVWIPLLGVLLAGIVAMQVEVLKLNAATGVSLQRTTALQNERDLLQSDVARLADDQRIESLAAQMGMQMPAPSQVKFLSPGAGSTRLAVANIHQPNPAAFLAQLPGDQTTGGVSTGAAPVSASTTDPTASTAGTDTSSSTTVTPSTAVTAPTTATPTTAVTAPTTMTPTAPTGTDAAATTTPSGG
jgi:cell division protein FtsL